MDSGIETFIQTGSGICADLTVRLNSHVVVVFFPQSQFTVPMWHLWMISQREKRLISHLLTRRWEIQQMGREEVPLYLANQSWCNVCVRACGRKNRYESRSQVQSKYTSHPMRLLHEERVSASDHFWQSSIQCADRWPKKGNRDPVTRRSLAAFARHVGHPNKITRRDSEHAWQVNHDACSALTPVDHAPHM